MLLALNGQICGSGLSELRTPAGAIRPGSFVDQNSPSRNGFRLVWERADLAQGRAAPAPQVKTVGSIPSVRSTPHRSQYFEMPHSRAVIVLSGRHANGRIAFADAPASFMISGALCNS